MLAMRRLQFFLILLLTLVIAACQGQAPETGPETSDEEPAGAEQNEQIDPGNDEAEGEITGDERMTQGSAEAMSLEQAVNAARQDLGNRSGVAADSIKVIEARNVTWRNGALGCPEEGMMYTQALVEGFYILLDDGRAEYAYHAGRDGQPFHCPADRSQPPASGDDAKAY
jgi:hypothetical protein